LAFCDGKEDDKEYPKDVFRLREEVKGAHGLILGTPEYHGGVSGVLKNALDLMGFEELEGKMIGLVGVSGGALGAVHALSHLRTVGRALHAWVIPEQAAVSEAWKAFDEKGNLKNPEIEKRLLDLGRQVARFSYLHTSERALEFLRLWEGAPMNPGAWCSKKWPCFQCFKSGLSAARAAGGPEFNFRVYLASGLLPACPSSRKND
jgi:NAD(P)H-dependent FMN reductase